MVLIVLLVCFTSTPECPSTMMGECSAVGRCVDGVCHCPIGYTGPDCSRNILHPCPNFCHGHGTCDLATKTCNCDSGYHGPDCQYIQECSELQFCSGNGICRNNKCECNGDWEGPDCGLPRQCDSNCSGQGLCQPPSKSSNTTHYHCNCNSPFGGSGCSAVTPPHAPCPNQCSGNGHCDHVTGKCLCFPGFTGPSCHSARSLCGWCGHGTCVSRKFGAVCVCDAGYHGIRCDIASADVLACADRSFCSGHGTCDEKIGVCNCDAGFSGIACDVITSEVCPNHCSGHGHCDYSPLETSSPSHPHQPVCVCDEIWESRDCSRSKCGTSANGKVCSGHGLCILDAPDGSGITRHHCECDSGHIGDDCSAIPLPCPENCESHGSCVEGECRCQEGWSGAACDVSITKAEEGPVCCPYGCSDNGECDMIACKCNCHSDWKGDACDVFALGDDSA
eukprot:c9358_g1_i1.p1 GENE.c9358_g1_i1~~c9358_g1_i1.p1  ORF type:complete len:449 (+),score=126.69 c9358_g1_i1:39-1385(+)